MDYQTIDLPYDNLMRRADGDMVKVESGENLLSGANYNMGNVAQSDDLAATSGGTQVSSPAQVRPGTVEGSQMADVWIDTWIKSTNYAPKERGFWIDGPSGYIECLNFFAKNATIEGTITATAGAIGGWTISANELSSGSVHINSTNEQILFGLATAPLTGVGIFIGKDGSDYEFRAGDPAGDFIHWTGAALNITGSITATTGAIGGFSIGSDYIRDAADSFGFASTVTGGNDVRIWAGSTFANRATAPYRVYEDGSVTATAISVGKLDIPDTTTANSMHVDTTGNTWWGTNEATGYATAPAYVLNTGAASFTSATVTGVITANSGYLGGATGWVVSTNYIKDAAGVVGLSAAVTGGDDIRFWAGHATPASAPFYVTESGALVASSATITGSITSTSGTIGGWTINATSITDTAAVVGLSSAVTGGDDIRFWAGNATPASAPFYVTEAGVIKATSGTIGGNTLGTNFISSSSFVSGPLGTGWRLMSTGEAEFQNVTVRGVIRTSVFEKDTISAVNGIVLVSKADVLDADMTALDASTVTITGETTFVNNEVIRIKDGTDDEWMLVTDASGAPTYVVTRDLAATYTANNNPVWKIGTAVVSMGVGTGTKTGFVLLDSSSASSPYIDIYGRNSNTYSDYTIHGRFGWLQGIVDSDVGLSSTDVWGLYTDNAYIKGVIVANTGYIGGTSGWVISAGYLKDAAGTVGLSAVVTGGDDIRFWAGDATPASAEFRVYESGAIVATSATITGAITATSGAIGGWVVTSDAIKDAAGVVGMLSTVTGGDDIRFFAGNATPGSAPFRVTEAGALVATSATITGAITATTGAIGGWVVTSDAIKDAAGVVGMLSTVTGGDDIRFFAGNATPASAPFRVTEAGALTASTATITGALTAAVGSVIATDYLSGTVAQTNLNIANQGWNLTCAFSSTDADTVSWGAGTLTVTGGTSYSIGAGNTGNMVARTYIYLDIAVSTIAFQVTTTATTAVGTGKIIVATAINGAAAATFQVFGGIGGTFLLGTDSIVANSITAGLLSVSQLSAITADLGTITAGSIGAGTATIGGWAIGADSIKDAAGVVGMLSTVTGGDDIRFFAGNATPASAPFRVTEAGALVATSATITGSITATTGTIGGWVIGADYIQDAAGVVGLSSAVTGGDDIRFWAGDATPGSAEFRVTEAGALTASSATITGVITANTGYIGGVTGWVIATGKITSTGIGVATSAGDATYAFWAGNDTPASAEFSVTHAGALSATGVSISGAITATSGAIGGFTINATTITDTAATFGLSSAVTGGDDIRFWAGHVTPGSAPFRVTEAGVISATSGTIGGNTLGSNFISSSSFVSGPLGSGWRIMSTGEAEFQNVTVRGTIRTSVFEKDTISAVNGIVLVSKADVLDSDMTALDASNVVITGETTFVNNEVIRIKDGTDDEWMLVTDASGAPTYVVTRDLAGSYTADNNPVWTTGTAVVSMGVGTGTKTGFVLLDSSSASSPYIDIYGRNSNTYSDYTIHGRFGWLQGIVDADVGLSSTDVWGLYTDNAYLKGVIVANTGYIGGTSGWVIAAGKITSTGIGLATTTGDATYAFWAGNDTPGSAEFRVSHAGALTATSATITGSITATSGTIGGWTINSTSITDAAGVVGLSSAVTGGDDIRFWAGDATPGSAEFRVTEAGALTATSATITGAITATSGAIGGWVVTSDAIKDAAGVVGLSSAVTGGDDIRFWAGDATPGSAEFRVTESGALTATSATITGAITATSGAIGGWVVTSDAIKDAAGVVGLSSAVTGGDDIRFWAGDATPGSAEFRVTEAGALTASSATITGTVTADTGYIGGAGSGWTIASGKWYGGSGSAFSGSIQGTGTTKSFFAGATDNAGTGALFYVTAAGDLVAQSATINGSALSNQNQFGDGSDGDVDINSGSFSSGPITSNILTRDAYFDDLTLSGGSLDCGGYRLFVKGILTINSTYKVHRDGLAGTAGTAGGDGDDYTGSSHGAGGAGGSGGAAKTSGSISGGEDGKTGGAGKNGRGTGSDPGDPGTAGDGSVKGFAANGADGSNGGTGGASGNPGSGTQSGGSGGGGGAKSGTVYNTPRNSQHAMRMADDLPSADSIRSSAGSGSGGGAGGGVGRLSSVEGFGGGGGGGGGSGSTGGIVIVFAKTIVNNGAISADGGAGGNGGDGGDGGDGHPSHASGYGGGGGGGGGAGGGGAGGVTIVVYSTKSGSGTITASGGAAGTTGTGGAGGIGLISANGSPGNNGSAANAGNAGKAIELVV